MRWSICLCGALIAGCARASYPDESQVSDLLECRIAQRTERRHGACLEERIVFCIQTLLQRELSPEDAAQIALFNNPAIQASFEELGVAHADLLEAGLLTNPSFEFEARYPFIKGLCVNVEYVLLVSLLDALILPCRKKAAAAAYEQAKLKAANDILDIALEAKETYYALAAEKKKIAYLESITELTKLSYDIMFQQAAAGNVSSLEEKLSQSKWLAAESEQAQAEEEKIRLEEKLLRLLGFHRQVSLTLPENLPLEEESFVFDSRLLESLALKHRLELQIARFEIVRLHRQLGLKTALTYANLKGGLAGEREPEGAHLIGLGFAGELPLFNYGQAARRRLFAQLRQARDRLAALEIQVVSEVREAHKIALSYWRLLEDRRERLLPLQRSLVASSEALYHVMGIGIDTLLETKRQEIEARRNYTEIQKKYLTAKIKLDRALGGDAARLISQSGSFE